MRYTHLHLSSVVTNCSWHRGLISAFYALTVNNDSGIILNNDIEIRNLLTLTKGYVYTGSNKLYVSNPSSASIISQNSFSNSYIMGILKWATNNIGPYFFPIGKPFGLQYMYAPIQIDKLNSGAAIYTAEYMPSVPLVRNIIESPPLDHISDVEYWKISSDQPSGNTSDDAYLTLSWRSYSTVSLNSAVRDSLIIAHYYNPGAGYEWMSEHTIGGTANAGNVVGSATSGTVKSNKIIAGFTPAESNFTLGSMSPFNALPLQIIAWDAQLFNKIVNTSWVINNDHNIDHYEIFKSVDGLHFNFMTRVNSLKQSFSTNYSAADNFPAFGWNFYRLKAIDEFGRSVTSTTRKVYLGSEINWTIYPNPASSFIMLSFTPTDYQSKTITLYDASGKRISTKITNSNIVNINIDNLAAGNYFFKVEGQMTYQSKSFVKE